MIKYLGSKRLLLPRILAAIEAVAPGPGARVLDLFSGTSRVGHALKRRGHAVVANDHNRYAAALATCYVQADQRRWADDAARLVAELDRLPGEPGWFTETFCRASRFFQPENGARVDAIRASIQARGLDPELEAVMLTSLLEAADRVDSTVGLQMAYLKTWARRSFAPLALRVPDLLPGGGRALLGDALDAAGEPCDVAYLDPPYNGHKYLGNYHIWESLVTWDKPEVYGMAQKRVDVRSRISLFNSRPRAADALRAVVERVAAPALVVSFNDEGHLTRAEIESILATRGHVAAAEIDFPRYVGARIGIFGPSGEKTGRVGRLRNRELLYVATPDRSALTRAARALATFGT